MRKLSETCALTRAFVCAQVKRAPLYDKHGKPIFQLTFELANKKRGLFLARNYIRTTEEFARISNTEEDEHSARAEPAVAARGDEPDPPPTTVGPTEAAAAASATVPSDAPHNKDEGQEPPRVTPREVGAIAVRTIPLGAGGDAVAGDASQQPTPDDAPSVK